MNINLKIILGMAVFVFFLITTLISDKLFLRTQDMGQIMGLGGVVIGYFSSKFFKK